MTNNVGVKPMERFLLGQLHTHLSRRNKSYYARVLAKRAVVRLREYRSYQRR